MTNLLSCCRRLLAILLMFLPDCCTCVNWPKFLTCGRRVNWLLLRKGCRYLARLLLVTAGAALAMHSANHEVGRRCT